MSARRRRPPPPLPLRLAELTIASWETIALRGWMMAWGTCPPAEYQRMVTEKADAAWRSAQVLATRPGLDGLTAALVPWHRRARANARRLRRI